MKTTHAVDVHQPATWPLGRVNMTKLDATTEEDIVRHQAQDDAEAHLVAECYARRVHKRLGLHTGLRFLKNDAKDTDSAVCVAVQVR